MDIFKYTAALIISVALNFGFSQSVADFTGTFRDQEGDVHTFEIQSDGSLLGHLTVGSSVTQVPFTLENGLAYGGLQLEDGSIFAIILTPEGSNLSVQLVPIGADNVPLIDQSQIYLFTRESPNPLSTQTAQNPLTPTDNPLTLTGTTIQANQTYTSGTPLISQTAGFSLIVPTDHTASYTVTETGQAGLVVSDQKNNGFIVLGLSKANIVDLAQSTLESFGDISLTPIETPQQSNDQLRASFQGEVNGTLLAIHLLAKQGPAGNAVIMLGFSNLEQSAIMRQTLDNTLNTLTFSQPVTNITLQLGGLELYADDNSSSSNSGNDAHLTGIKNEHYVFCSDSSYGYSVEDTTLFSGGDFGDFSSEESDQHQGVYELSSGMLGELYLRLKASDGRSFIHPVFQEANGLIVGGSSFSVTQSTQCQ